MKAIAYFGYALAVFLIIATLSFASGARAEGAKEGGLSPSNPGHGGGFIAQSSSRGPAQPAPRNEGPQRPPVSTPSR